MKRISIKKMAVLLFCTALLTGCGPKSEVSLPDDFPMDLEFSSGVGGWGTSLTLERDGTVSGQFHGHVSNSRRISKRNCLNFPFLRTDFGH